VDRRTDQFALGIVLAEMASGSNPFDAGTFAATIALVMRADGLPVPLDGAVVSADIAAIVNRCTRHRREDRFASTGDLVAALAACRAGAGVAALPLAAPRSSSIARARGRRRSGTGRRPALW
jgi:serine/threonine protein kinase